MTPIPSPPIAATREHIREHHGDRVTDPYEWLRDGEDPAVRAYLDDENAYADSRTAHLKPLRDSIFGEIKQRVLETDLSVPVRSGPWWYYSRTVEGQQYAIHARVPVTDPASRPVVAADAAPEGEQVIVDGNAEAGDSEFFSIGALAVSPDHTRLALATDVTGDERFDLVVRDLESGETLDDGIKGIGYGVEFSYDGRTLFYTRLDDAWRPHQLWRHVVGADPSDDVLVHEEADERFWMGIGTSRDDRWIIHALGSKTTSEVRLLDATTPTQDFRVVAPRRDGVEYDVEPAGDRLLIVHNTDNPDSDLAWAPLGATSHEEWVPLLAAGEGERFLGIDAFDDVAVLSLRREGLTALSLLAADPTHESGYAAPVPVSFDEPIYSVGLGDNPERAQSSLQVVYESFVTPRTVLDLDIATGERTILKQQPVLGGVDLNDYVQRREWATASDGTQVPISIVHRSGLEPDGSHPGLLTAYGAYEHSSDPYFSVARLSLLDRGVIHATAHVRGGGEMGRHWYDNGKLLAKPHTFSDTVACADRLVQLGWVAPDRLGLEGGSAGGLLVGAVVNLAPDRFRVAHASVPFVDALTTILRPDLPLTVGEWEEWGNPLEDPEVYAVMKGYTPYENVAAQGYPAILATTSLNDTRVFFTEAAKWVARLRATVTNDQASRPILLRTEMSAGHGGRSGRYAAWEQIAWEWAFVLDQLGATSRLPTRSGLRGVDDHERARGAAEEPSGD
ncbi:protease [Knoellia sinensis KCTC 19936]|uniref:Protease n=1 Tax=Knoellia sinensis KCTC 19936 TaxID=1385520 RepID=A0A0A0J6Y8_9MICO|nr:S9 family peptidase [Knoellia sinensis]KGN33130.1 protease [Knoellia sinensis KCTC 19936]